MKNIILCSILFVMLSKLNAQNSNLINAIPPELYAEPVRAMIYDHAKNFPNHTQISIAIVDQNQIDFIGIIRENDTIRTMKNHHLNFEIGSISKVFTSTLLTSLVLEQKIELNEPINGYIDVLPSFTKKISFLHLSNHTSGLGRLPSNLNLYTADFNNPYKAYDAEDLEAYYKSEIQTPSLPGQTYAYSNLGAGTLGYLLAKISDTTYEALLKDKICDKYGLRDTTTEIQKIKNQLVQARNYKGDPTDNWDMNVLVGAGGIYSTSQDLGLFALAQFDKENKEIQRCQQETFTVSDHMKCALGWHILDTTEGQEWLWHNGATGGYTSSFALNVSQKKAVIVLSNVSAYHKNMGNIDELCFALLKYKEVNLLDKP